MPADVVQQKIRLPATPRAARKLYDVIRPLLSVPAKPTSPFTTTLLLVRPERLAELHALVKRAGGQVMWRRPYRQWEPAEIASAEFFAVDRTVETSWLRAVWDSPTELDTAGACPACKTGHRWTGPAQFETLDRIRPLPSFSVSVNNAHIVSSAIRLMLEAAAPKSFHFAPVKYRSSRTLVSTHWVVRARRTFPPISSSSLLRHNERMPGCDQCRRDAWEASDLSLTYSIPTPSSSVLAAETHECDYVARLPRSVGHPGISALPWLVVRRAVASVFLSAPFLRRVSLRPVLFRPSNGKHREKP